jgi:hypothetical protein
MDATKEQVLRAGYAICRVGAKDGLASFLGGETPFCPGRDLRSLSTRPILPDSVIVGDLSPMTEAA